MWKKIKNILVALAIMFVSFWAIFIVGCFIFPVNEQNVLQTPGSFDVFVIFTPIVLAVLYLNREKLKRLSSGEYSLLSKNKETVNPDGSISEASKSETDTKTDAKSFYDAEKQAEKKPVEEKKQKPLFQAKKPAPSNVKIPFGKKNRIAAAKDLLDSVNYCAKRANETTSIYTFILNWDAMIKDLSTLTAYEGKVPFTSGFPSADLRRLNGDFQWKMRDCIERAERAAISDINGLYKNSKEHQLRRVREFCTDIDISKDRFELETSEFAKKALDAVCKAAGVNQSSETSGGEAPASTVSLDAVDLMDGTAFEHFCASILKKNGFVNVSVTPPSGDQGVDVLAEKGGVKYAIQCKCYSSDLGNSPVQEVHTGKALYHCHIGVVMTNRYFTTGAREAAEATGVLLWDRAVLASMIEKANNI